VSLSAPDPSPHVEQEHWFETEVRPHEPALRNFLRRKYPGLSEVDDVVQESYIKLIFARELGRITSVKGFLFAVAHNSAISLFRKKRRISEIPVNEIKEPGVLEDNANVVGEVCSREHLAIVTEAIGQLPARCRRIVALRLLQGMEYPDIAEELGISEQTARVQLARGVKRCADFLRKRGVTGATAP